MIFRYVQEKQNLNGSTERLATDYAQSELVLGRGGDSHLIFLSKRVSLVHAKFIWKVGREAEREIGRLQVLDLGSLAGVRVNGSRVAQTALQDNDLIQLGDIELRIRIADDDVVELIHIIKPVEEGKQHEHGSKLLKSLRVESYLPSMRILIWGVTLVCTGILFVFPLSSKRMESWSSGPISNSHKLIEADCKKCHAEPFMQVQDRECLSCHAMTEHAKGIESFNQHHPELKSRCGECHIEHEGDHGLISHDPGFCVSCHADMNALKTDATVENVASFANHPQFRINVTDTSGVTSRVSLDDTVKAVDSSQIKLNHEVHLKAGLRGKDGPLTLECNACHELNANFKTLKPISFDKHCRDCHSLGFDEQLPNVEVPHGDSEAIYPALFTEYTKLLLLKDVRGLPETSNEMQRRIPDGAVTEASPELPVNIELIAQSARTAERELFTKTGCFLCHTYSEKLEAERSDTNSHYTVVKPNIPEVWFTAARFSHGAHEEFSCESCHDKTRTSTKTTDLLIPGKKLCQECHAQEQRVGFVKSGCVECHSYHDALGFPEQRKQDIVEFLHELTR